MRIGIAGAGLMGRLMAWQLLRQGHQVSLFDSDVRDGSACTARIAAAMLAPYSEALSCEPAIVAWGLTGLELWPTLLQHLKSDSGNSTPFQRQGSIVVAHPQDHNNLLDFNRLLHKRLNKHQQQDIQKLEPRDLLKLEPELSKVFKQGTFLPQEGCIDNWSLLDNLATAIVALGGIWHEHCHIEQVCPGTLYTSPHKQTLNFDWVIDTRGLGAKPQQQDLRGVRGEILWVKAPEVKLSRPIRLMHPRYQLYIVPKPNDVYAIGATEIESESMAPMTVRSSLELQSALYSVHSGFAEANILHAYANCRPAYMDNMPRIIVKEGLMSINGLYRHGYLLAPFIVQAALKAIQGGDFPHLTYRTDD